jgi:hypothetical protein
MTLTSRAHPLETGLLVGKLAPISSLFIGYKIGTRILEPDWFSLPTEPPAHWSNAMAQFPAAMPSTGVTSPPATWPANGHGVSCSSLVRFVGILDSSAARSREPPSG